jgi:hypothetical protein
MELLRPVSKMYTSKGDLSSERIHCVIGFIAFDVAFVDAVNIPCMVVEIAHHGRDVVRRQVEHAAAVEDLRAPQT